MRAMAWCAYTLGVLIAVLALTLEPRELKDIPHGIVLGMLIARAPLVMIPLSKTPPLSTLAFAEGFAWCLAVVASLPGLFPTLIFIPLLRVLPSGALLLVVIAYGAAVLESVVAVARASVVVVASLIDEVRTVGLFKGSLTLLFVLAATGLVAALLTVGPPLQWLDPPRSFDARVAFSILLAPALAYAARRLTAQREPDESRPAWSAEPRPVAALAALVLLEIAVVLQADRIAPFGAIPSSLVAEAAGQRPELARDGVSEQLFALAQRRSGLNAGGERFVVRYGPELVAPPFDSEADFEDDGRVIVRLNDGITDARRRNLLTYQYTRALLGLHSPTLDPGLALGYAYWSADNPSNPFVTGSESGASPKAACDALPSMTLDSSETFTYALMSLPFVMAERAGGARESQRLLMKLAPASPDDVRARVAEQCIAYLRAFPPPQELLVEAPPAFTQPLDSDVVKASFEDAKSRSGLDAYGRQIVVRPGAPLGGGFTHSDFGERSRVVVTVSPSLPRSSLREALTYQFAGIFVTVRYGEFEPVRAGFASWVAREKENPFMSSATSARSLCAQAASWDFTRNTTGTVYLSSLPFFDVERTGGIEAARSLAHSEFAAQRVDLAAWRGTVQRACGRVALDGSN
jgi:hypothetical protein